MPVQFAPSNSLTSRAASVLATIAYADLFDYPLTLDEVFLDSTDPFVRVMGKGRKERELGLGKSARAALLKYITRFRGTPKGEQHVFLTRHYNPMTVNALDQLFYRLRDWAGIEGVRCSPHTARHTFALNYLQATGDIYRLSRLMGHAGVHVTEGYLKALKSREVRQEGISVLDRLK